MKEKDFTKKINDIQEKLGKDNSNLILDDLAELINDNKQMNLNEEKITGENKRLEKLNETLQTVNGNLLQQVAMGKEEDIINTPEKKNEKEKKEEFDFRTVFDENRKF